MAGRIDGDGVVVADAPEASRLHNRGRFGKPLSGGGVRLSLVEAAFLVESGRLRISGHPESTVLARLLEHGARTVPRFEVEYLAYRDLRGRGFTLAAVSQREAAAGFTWVGRGKTEAIREAAPEIAVAAYSERDSVNIPGLQGLIAASEGRRAMVALVDEESDVTYYEVFSGEPSGDRTPAVTTAQATLMEDRLALWDADAVRNLHGRHFVGKPLDRGLQIGMVEALHLVRHSGMRVVSAASGRRVGFSTLKKRARERDPDVAQRLVAYSDLVSRGLVVKTGFKFGTHFRAYDGDPRSTHAPFLVHAVISDHESTWPQVSRAVRLAHTVRKTFLYAVVGGRRVGYVGLARALP